jgi:hypothetical protein
VTRPGTPSGVSAGKISAQGFEVEIAIPWSSSASRAGKGRPGAATLRFTPRDQRHRISSHPLDRNVSCYLCQASKMTGFAGVTPGRNLEVVRPAANRPTRGTSSTPRLREAISRTSWG